MDPVSQAALGAAWAQPLARTPSRILAIALGACAGMAADLDTLIRSDTDPLLALEYHRHFTHSLVFIPAGALVCALVAHLLLRSRLSLRSCYTYCVLGFASHGLLDACTSYGTMLFWPFSDMRVAWNLVSVIDPLFTGPLIVGVLVGARSNKRKPVLVGLGWCVLYLSVAAMQNMRATAVATELATSRGHVGADIVAKPSFANLLVWKIFYARDGGLYIDAVRVGFESALFEGERLSQLVPERDFPWLPEQSQQRRDVDRLYDFANGFVAVDRESDNRVMDVRYSLVPNRGDGFWGLELDPEAGADTHAAYVTMRLRTMAEGRELLRMMFQGEKVND